jgi:hypothetical protein
MTKYAGVVDSDAADDAPEINSRRHMEHDKIYRRAGRTYCSRCGTNSAQRGDLVAVLIPVRGSELGHAVALCPSHLERWKELHAVAASA